MWCGRWRLVIEVVSCHFKVGFPWILFYSFSRCQSSKPKFYIKISSKFPTTHIAIHLNLTSLTKPAFENNYVNIPKLASLAMFHINFSSVAVFFIHHFFSCFDSEFIRIMRNNFFVCTRKTQQQELEREKNVFRLRTKIRFQLAPLLAFISPAWLIVDG